MALHCLQFGVGRKPNMHAVIGRVKIKPGHEDETQAMIANNGIAMVHGMPGSCGGYWSRNIDNGDLIQHSFWLFDSEENARSAESIFNTLRNMPEARPPSSAWKCVRLSLRHSYRRVRLRETQRGRGRTAGWARRPPRRCVRSYTSSPMSWATTLACWDIHISPLPGEHRCGDFHRRGDRAHRCGSLRRRRLLGPSGWASGSRRRTEPRACQSDWRKKVFRSGVLARRSRRPSRCRSHVRETNLPPARDGWHNHRRVEAAERGRYHFPRYLTHARAATGEVRLELRACDSTLGDWTAAIVLSFYCTAIATRKRSSVVIR